MDVARRAGPAGRPRNFNALCCKKLHRRCDYLAFGYCHATLDSPPKPGGGSPLSPSQDTPSGPSAGLNPVPKAGFLQARRDISPGQVLLPRNPGLPGGAGGIHSNRPRGGVRPFLLSPPSTGSISRAVSSFMDFPAPCCNRAALSAVLLRDQDSSPTRSFRVAAPHEGATACGPPVYPPPPRPADHARKPRENSRASFDQASRSAMSRNSVFSSLPIWLRGISSMA